MSQKEERHSYSSLAHTFTIILLFLILGIMLWQISKAPISESLHQELRVKLDQIEENMRKQTEKKESISEVSGSQGDVVPLLNAYLSMWNAYKKGEAFHPYLEAFVDLGKKFGLNIQTDDELLNLSQVGVKNYHDLLKDLDGFDQAFIDKLAKKYTHSPERMEGLVSVKDKKRLTEDPEYKKFAELKDAFIKGGKDLEGFKDLSGKFEGMLDSWIQEAEKRFKLDQKMEELKGSMEQQSQD